MWTSCSPAPAGRRGTGRSPCAAATARRSPPRCPRPTTPIPPRSASQHPPRSTWPARCRAGSGPASPPWDPTSRHRPATSCRSAHPCTTCSAAQRSACPGVEGRPFDRVGGALRLGKVALLAPLPQLAYLAARRRSAAKPMALAAGGTPKALVFREFLLIYFPQRFWDVLGWLQVALARLRCARHAIRTRARSGRRTRTRQRTRNSRPLVTLGEVHGGSLQELASGITSRSRRSASRSRARSLMTGGGLSSTSSRR